MTGYGPQRHFPWTSTVNYLRTDGPEPRVAPVDLSQVEVRWTVGHNEQTRGWRPLMKNSQDMHTAQSCTTQY